MRALHAFLADQRGAAAGEFALVLPLVLIFLLGIVDVGYYAWTINRGEKATQIGARWAVATDLVPADLKNYSFAISGGIQQGTTVPEASLPPFTCTSTGCTQWGFDGAAFNAIRDRMQEFYPEIEDENIQLDYRWSGLGYAGDPNGPDVAPIVTVRLVNMQHRPIFSLLLGTVDLPDFAYSLTTEDSDGSFSN